MKPFGREEVLGNSIVTGRLRQIGPEPQVKRRKPAETLGSFTRRAGMGFRLTSPNAQAQVIDSVDERVQNRPLRQRASFLSRGLLSAGLPAQGPRRENAAWLGGGSRL